VLNGQKYAGNLQPKGQKILYIQYTNPARYPPLEHSSRILGDSGWQVVFLGTGTFGKADGTDFSNHVNIRVRLLPFCRAGWRQKLHYARFCIWACGWVLTWRPKWVYASDLLACPVALVISWISGVRFIYHEHDSPEQVSEGVFQSVALWSRSMLARRAECCVLPNRRRAEHFASVVPSARQVLCTWNCPSREEVPAMRSGPSNKELWVLYQGSLVPARLPAAVLGAMRELPSQVKLRVVGYETVGSPTFLREFIATASQLGVRDRVDIVGKWLPRSQMLENARNCDVGLALMPTCSDDRNEQEMAGASNKAFEYLACGLAVLVSDLPDWTSMYVEPGYGLSCVPEEPSSIADALSRFLQNRECTKAMGQRGRSRIVSEWNYETQFAPVLELMQEKDRTASSTARDL
jgi:glycosyltransferase involved in cell wall biosynthesis